eukprot:PITA_13808
MKDLGAAKHILGMDIHKDRKNGKLWLSQQKYVEKVLEKYCMNNVKPVNVPLASHFKLSSILSPRTDEESCIFLMYHMQMLYATYCRRWYLQDLTFHMQLELSAASWQIQVIWTKEDLLQVMSLLFHVEQLVGCQMGLQTETKVDGSIERYKARLVAKGKLQETVALSNTEAKYIAASNASKEAIWLKGLLDEIGRTQKKVNVLCDSQSVIHLDISPAYHSKTKHIDVRYHILRHVIDGGKVALQKVHTRENCADIITKPVTIEKLRWCLASLGLQKK